MSSRGPCCFMEKTMMHPLWSSCNNRRSKTMHIPLLCVAVLLLFLASPATSCKEEEKNSLLGFLDGLSQNSGLTTSWQNDTNCCLWEGIICNTDGVVMDISLASIGLEGHISPSLGNLTSLLRLNLSGNSLSGGLPLELLLSSSIGVLDVSFNKLNGEFQEVQSPPDSRMKVINISSNLFTGYFPSTILGSMKNLAALNMSNNSFTGGVPSTLCVDKPFFVVLDFSYNQFHGRIPKELGNCSGLKVLKAGKNQLIGTIPAELFNVTTLEHLSFPNNHLQGTLEHVGKLRNLVILDLGWNGLNGKIPDSIGQLKRLEELHLDNNNMSGELPSALSNCSNLTTIILKDNNFKGELKHVNFSTLSNLRFLDCRSNKFTGTIPDSLYSCSNLIALRLSFNKLHGQFSLGIRNLRSLRFLALSHNNFTNITNALQILGKSRTLALLLIGGNFKHEIMPDYDYDTFYGFENLMCLAIDDCSLYGHLPNWLAKLKNLRGLLLDNNKLSGPIPNWINSLSLLFYLDISNNNLTGEIPTALMEMPTLQSAHSAPIVLKFPIYLTPFLQYRTTGGFPKMLNLANNKFTGAIPPQIGQLQALLTLNLSFNNLHGEIPQSIGNLTNLQVLDLSCNDMTGAIPSSLERLHFLSKFNISSNDLEGPVPTGGQFSTFQDSSFFGNPKLCSPTLMHHCNSAEATPFSTISTGQYIDKVILAVAFGMFFGVGVLYDQMVLSRYIYFG